MKKIVSFIVAVIFFLGMVCIHDAYQNEYIKDHAESMLYVNDDRRNFCIEAMEAVLDEQYHGIIVFGSSELGNYMNGKAFPQKLYQNGNSDFNMILTGRGYMQSLHHAISAGALAESIQSRKVVLILSPQWFTVNGVESNAYVSRFSEQMYIRMMQNDNISKETKRAVTDRLDMLLAEDRIQRQRLLKYNDKSPSNYLNIIERAGQKLYFSFMEKKRLNDAVKMIRGMESEKNVECMEASAVNFENLRKEAVLYAKRITTNNRFGIYDEYFDTWIRNGLENSKNSAQGAGYTVSQEYDDFRLFLDICGQTGLKPLVISIPVNGRWYDYTGFSKEGREQYYQNIRDICAAYDVELADFSDKEYELYFLKDTMHLGAKGWAYVDEAVYRFYQKDLS